MEGVTVVKNAHQVAARVLTQILHTESSTVFQWKLTSK